MFLTHLTFYWTRFKKTKPLTCEHWGWEKTNVCHQKREKKRFFLLIWRADFKYSSWLKFPKSIMRPRCFIEASSKAPSLKHNFWFSSVKKQFQTNLTIWKSSKADWIKKATDGEQLIICIEMIQDIQQVQTQVVKQTCPEAQPWGTPWVTQTDSSHLHTLCSAWLVVSQNQVSGPQ